MAQSPSTGGISFLSDSQNSVSVTESGSETQNDDGSPSMVSANPDWQRSVSASFSQLSLHFQAAAQAVASVPPSSDQTILALMERLDSIEDGQRRLAQELASLKEEFAALHNQAATLAENLPQPSQSSQPPAVNGISDLEAAIKTQAEALKLECVSVGFRDNDFLIYFNNLVKSACQHVFTMLLLPNRLRPSECHH